MKYIIKFIFFPNIVQTKKVVIKLKLIFHLYIWVYRDTMMKMMMMMTSTMMAFQPSKKMKISSDSNGIWFNPKMILTFFFFPEISTSIYCAHFVQIPLPLFFPCKKLKKKQNKSIHFYSSLGRKNAIVSVQS